MSEKDVLQRRSWNRAESCISGSSLTDSFPYAKQRISIQGKTFAYVAYELHWHQVEALRTSLVLYLDCCWVSDVSQLLRVQEILGRNRVSPCWMSQHLPLSEKTPDYKNPFLVTVLWFSLSYVFADMPPPPCGDRRIKRSAVFQNSPVASGDWESCTSSQLSSPLLLSCYF
jgi:hypothetical protein